MSAPDPEVVERVKAAKAARESSAHRYRDTSRLAFVVHSFNRAGNVEQLASGLRRLGDEHELVVCDDGSLDGSRELWAERLDRPNDFLLLSNDVHEIRILDRAIHFARSEIVCLVQDDDAVPPPDGGWLEEILERFERHPDLAVVGGFMGFHGFAPDPEDVEQLWGEGPFRFVDHVNIGPYFVRRSHYLALGGWDHSFSRAGEPGICFDNELCLRAWTRGFAVGYRFVPFKGPAGHYALDGGTVLFSGGVRRANQLRNSETIWRTYRGDAEAIADRVEAANRELGDP